MTRNEFYALVFGFYLSKFDKEGYQLLEFKTFTEAYNWGTSKFEVAKSSVKNIRDAFDSNVSELRVGHKSELDLPKQKICDLFNAMDIHEMQSLCKDIKADKKSEKLDSLYGEFENIEYGGGRNKMNAEQSEIKRNELILEDISEIIKNINESYKEKYEDKFENVKVILSDKFKNEFEEKFNEIYEVKSSIYNENGLLVVYDKTDHREYIFNTEILLATFTSHLYLVVQKYKKVAIDILVSSGKYTKVDMSSEKKPGGAFINVLRGIPTKGEKKVQDLVGNESMEERSMVAENFIKPYFEEKNIDQNIREKNIEYMKKFFCDSEWWSGGKNFCRNDFFVSPILGVFNLVAQASGSIEKIVKVYAKYPELLENIKDEIRIEEYEFNQEDAFCQQYPVIDPDIDRKNGGENLIVYGAPGTGKSHYIEEQYKENIKRVVFHPEYTYFDFVGSYRPVPVYKKTAEKFINLDKTVFGSGEPHIDYRFVTGPFIDVFIKAWQEPDRMHTLIIEELNRADAAAVFGSVFQLLDRDKNGTSEYAIDPSEELRAELINQGLEECIKDGLRIPSNMNIVATMNSADQGVNFMDTAFKRRWRFEYLEINTGNAEHKNEKISYANSEITWGEFVEKINEKLTDRYKIEEDRLLGPYFVGSEELRADPQKAIKKVLFYLWDDVLRHKNRSEMFNGVKNMAGLMNDFTQKDVLGIMDDVPDEE